MSPPVDPPPGRQRTFSRPPTPRDDVNGRLTDVEHALEGQQDTNARILDELRTQSGTLTTIKGQVDRFLIQREEELKAQEAKRLDERLADEKRQKRSDRWKAAVFSGLAALTVGLIGWIAKIAMIVQSSKVP